MAVNILLCDDEIFYCTECTLCLSSYLVLHSQTSFAGSDYCLQSLNSEERATRLVCIKIACPYIITSILENDLWSTDVGKTHSTPLQIKDYFIGGLQVREIALGSKIITTQQLVSYVPWYMWKPNVNDVIQNYWRITFWRFVFKSPIHQI